ncbi:L-histidine N(alpha)-methyltransferase [Aestuariibius insulae]|uniref:L-histidine N(alpha)-methyltransferase n=1 Tax=Aestuariibius insulae TaxID=2058287 RepID=UPI00345EAE12
MDKRIVENQALLNEARAGLTAIPKSLPSKWLYDDRGSALFEQITGLPEYYPTRTEIGILTDTASRLARYVPKGGALVELGSGSSLKTRILLDQLPDLGTYLPIDVSASFLQASASDLARSYASITVTPVVADFSDDIDFPVEHGAQPKTAFFPGSTLGNLTADEATALLTRVRQWPGIEAFIIGIDLVKDIRTLINAYDDAAGVTAAFNRNILHRINREAGGTFDPDRFAHEARWSSEHSRIEMHLVSHVAQTVQLAETEIAFRPGESIHTESSHKYTEDTLEKIVRAAGWTVDLFLTDASKAFAVAALRPK